MIYYAVAMTVTILLCSYNTKTYSLDIGAEANCFRNARVAFLVLLPLTFLALFRWDVGVDSLYGGTYWESYQDAVNDLNSRDFELGFYWLMRLFAQQGVPFFWFLFALSLLFMLFVSVAISRGSVWTTWSVLVFFLLAVYFDCYSSLRQSLAEAISLIAWAEMGFRSPSKKKDIRILLIFAFAGLFHITAWMNIPIYLVCKIRFSRSGLLKFLILALLLTPILQILIQFSMQLLTENSHYYYMGAARINALMSLILAILCWYFYDEVTTLDENAYMYLNSAVCIFVLLINSGAMYLPYRVFDMLKIGYIFIVPYLLRGIKQSRVRLYTQLCILLIFGMWFVNYYFLQDAAVANYQSVFSVWNTVTKLP